MQTNAHAPVEMEVVRAEFFHDEDDDNDQPDLVAQPHYTTNGLILSAIDGTPWTSPPSGDDRVWAIFEGDVTRFSDNPQDHLVQMWEGDKEIEWILPGEETYTLEYFTTAGTTNFQIWWFELSPESEGIAPPTSASGIRDV